MAGQDKTLKALYAYLDDTNNVCPLCNSEIKIDQYESIFYSKTRRGTWVFWHKNCTKKEAEKGKAEQWENETI